MAENCPPPGESLPVISVDEITIHAVAPNVPPGGNQMDQGVQVQLDLSVRHIVESADQPSWLEDEIMRRYLNVRVIQVRNPEADRFITGAMTDLTRRNLLGRNLTSPANIGTILTEANEMLYNGGVLEYAGYPYRHHDASHRGRRTQQGIKAQESVINLTAMMVGINDEMDEFHRLLPGTLGERANFRTPRFPEEPPFIDIAYPMIDRIGNMVYFSFGAPLGIGANPYKQIGSSDHRINLDNGGQISTQGLVTIYNRPLANDEGNLLLQNPETITVGGQTTITGRLAPVFFGDPQNINNGDKVLTSADISYLSYHAFLYVDINRMLGDMELDDE